MIPGTYGTSDAAARVTRTFVANAAGRGLVVVTENAVDFVVLLNEAAGAGKPPYETYRPGGLD